MSFGSVNDLVLGKLNPDNKISKMIESDSISAVRMLEDEWSQNVNIKQVSLSEIKSKNDEKSIEESKDGHEAIRSPTEIAESIIYELIQKVEENVKGKLPIDI